MFRNIILFSAMATSAIASPVAVHAAVFDLRAAGVENLDGGQSLQLTVDGITATVSTLVGVLNQEAGGFGATTGPDNDGDFLVNGQEVITIDFDTDVIWGGFTASGQSEANCGTISLNDVNPMLFCGSGPIALGNGTVISSISGIVTIRPVDTSGFSIDSFTVTQSPVSNDADNDGIPDSDDRDPNDPFVCADDDNDGCDDCSVQGVQDTSDDGPDQDFDGICDAGDDDIDGDSIPNETDPDPTDGRICGDSDEDSCDDCSIVGLPDASFDGNDIDGDGICDAGDDDIDGDSIPNNDDPAPLDHSICGDSDGDTCDDCRVTGGPPDPLNDGADTDGDGICDAASGGDPDMVIIDLRDPSMVPIDDSLVICGRSGNAVAMLINRGGGEFSRGPDGFGIDALIGSDIAERIDGDEEVEIQFNYDVRWMWVEALTDDSSDCAEVRVAGGTPITICGTNPLAVGNGTVIPRTADSDRRGIKVRAVGNAAISLERVAFVPLRAQSIVDLQLSAQASNTTPMLADEITITFSVENIGPADADDVSVQINTPTQLEISSVATPTGTSFNPENGIWTIGHVDTNFRFKGDDRPQLVMRAIVRGGDEVFFVSGEIATSLQADEDSTPGNGLVDEDDDDELTIDIFTPEDVPPAPNPLLIALLEIFTCGAVSAMTNTAIVASLIVVRSVRKRYRR